MTAKSRPLPIATALRESMKKYSAATLREDLSAGLVVSLVALPLSMALAIAVGLPPQHGLYTAIVAGIAAALLGGSTTQVSGPTAAFVVIVAPIVADLGLRGIIWCQFLAGAMLVLMGVFRWGGLVRYVPYPVTTGFTAGIAVTIGTLALNDFFGLKLGQINGHYIDKAAAIAAALPSFTAQEAAVGAVSLLVMIFFPKITRKIPGPVAGIVVGTGLALALSRQGIPIDTIANRFSFALPGGGTGAGIPPQAPSFHLPGGSDAIFAWPSLAELKILILPAVAIAALAALESLLSATVADSMARTRHDPDAELSGIGIANILSGMAAGVPATGAIARTATNIHAGAKTPVASAFHAVLLLVYMLTLAPLINHMPMAALAALLLTVAWRMSHAPQFVRILKIASAGDRVVLIVTFLLTVFIDMVAGVAAGMALACLVFLKRAADSATAAATSEAHGQKVPDGTLLLRFEGPLFFGSVDRILGSIAIAAPETKRVILDLTSVPVIDVTGTAALEVFLAPLIRDGRSIAICATGKNAVKLRKKLHGLDPSCKEVIFETVGQALKHTGG